MRVSSSFGCIFFLLYVGHILLERLVVLPRVMIPSSFLGGLAALAVIQLSNVNPMIDGFVQQNVISGLSALPVILTNAMFVQVKRRYSRLQPLRCVMLVFLLSEVGLSHAYLRMFYLSSSGILTAYSVPLCLSVLLAVMELLLGCRLLSKPSTTPMERILRSQEQPKELWLP